MRNARDRRRSREPRKAMGDSINTLVPNPFQGQGLGNENDNITLGQLARPFAQFQDVFAKRVDSGRSRYDAVKLELEKRFRGRLKAFARPATMMRGSGTRCR